MREPERGDKLAEKRDTNEGVSQIASALIF